MYRLKTFIRKTRNNTIQRVVREHYLRDDISCQSAACKQCQAITIAAAESTAATNNNNTTNTNKLLSTTGPYYILDTNIILHQLDLIEYSCSIGLFTNLILLSTVLDEVRSNNIKLYKRARKLTERTDCNIIVFNNEYHRLCYIDRLDSESINDRNDRAIRTACKYYNNHINNNNNNNTKNNINIILITEDRGNRAAAAIDIEQVNTISCMELIKQNSSKYPQLVDYMAVLQADSTENNTNKSNNTNYPEHIPTTECQRLVTTGALKSGSFKINRDYYSEAIVNIRGLGAVLIPNQLSMNRAIDGDIVAIELLDKQYWKSPATVVQLTMDESDVVNLNETNSLTSIDSNNESDNNIIESTTATHSTTNTVMPTGRVVGIIQRNWRSYCGSLELTDRTSGSLLFLSVNKRIPRIKIQSKQIELLMDKRILVQIDSWPSNSKYPLGHYISTIGTIGDRDCETTVLLIEHDIPTAPWTNSVLACLPADTNQINQSDCIGRSDFRSLSIFSIDPVGCTDIDDALHIRLLSNGNYEVGVHIADVSHYIQPNSAIDIEGSHRGTSVYLVDKRIDMLPSLLSTNLCSLKSNIDRLTFSVLWEITPDAVIIDTTFHKAVIRSCNSFTYGQAQDRIDSNNTDPITMACKQLNNLAKIMKSKRIESGALLLASTEVKFVMNKESQQPSDVEMYQLKEANSLVEEFMLLANISVAKRILEYYPNAALLRRHPTPDKENFTTLIKAASAVGFNISINSSKELADSLDRAIIPNYPFFNKLIRILATRAMTQAIYFSSGDCNPSDYHHYGLAAPVYTHFTSPIRRYADIVVHRLLAASLNLAPLPADIEDKTKVRAMAENINHRHRMAQLVSRSSTELFTLIFFNDRIVTESAMIIAIKTNGFRVIIPRYGIEGTINLWKEQRTGTNTTAVTTGATAASEKNPYIYNDTNLTLSGLGRTFKIFEQILVTIYVATGANRRKWLQVDLASEGGSNATKEIIAHASNSSNSNSNIDTSTTNTNNNNNSINENDSTELLSGPTFSSDIDLDADNQAELQSLTNQSNNKNKSTITNISANKKARK